MPSLFISSEETWSTWRRASGNAYEREEGKRKEGGGQSTQISISAASQACRRHMHIHCTYSKLGQQGVISEDNTKE